MKPTERLDVNLLKATLVEFLVTTLFLFITIGTVCNGCKISDFADSSAPGGMECPLTSARVVEIAASFGFSIAVLVYCAASFSGGHINPAVTLAFAITKKISLLRAALYITAQVGGAILGSFIVSVVNKSGWETMNGGTNSVPTGQSLVSIWLLEFMLTFLLVFVVFCATDNDRGETAAHLPVLAPFAIGFAVFIAHLCAIPLDGCSINPARSFGPAVIIGRWEDQWLFWVGPLSGGAFAALVYELLLRPGTTKLIIPGSGLEAGTEEAKLASLPAYAGVQGVDEVDEVEKAGF